MGWWVGQVEPRLPFRPPPPSGSGKPGRNSSVLWTWLLLITHVASPIWIPRVLLDLARSLIVSFPLIALPSLPCHPQAKMHIMCVQCKTLCYNQTVRLAFSAGGRPHHYCVPCFMVSINQTQSPKQLPEQALAMLTDPLKFVKFQLSTYELSSSDDDSDAANEVECRRDPFEITWFIRYPAQYLQDVRNKLYHISATDFDESNV